MKFDDKNNRIEVCLFECHLARYFIEHPEIFKPLENKIYAAIEQLIAINHNNDRFERILFSVFSIMTELNPNLDTIEALKESNSVIVLDTFLKHFTERVMQVSSLRYPERHCSQSMQTSSLSALACCSLFKTSISAEASLLAIMRPKNLFSDKNRGVIELDHVSTNEKTRHLGLLHSADVPVELSNYFTTPHVPCRQYYKPKEDSLMALWLRQYFLPVISGASGGIGKTVSKLASIVSLSKNEYQLLGLLIASSTIALGHHSFFEVMRPLSFFTGNLEEKNTLFDFYEQTIPDEIKQLPSYQSHIESEYGANLIEECVFEKASVALPFV